MYLRDKRIIFYVDYTYTICLEWVPTTDRPVAVHMTEVGLLVKQTTHCVMETDTSCPYTQSTTFNH